MLLWKKEYTQAFADAADGLCILFFYENYIWGLSSNDVSVNDLNFDAADKMEDCYQYYKEKIQSDYTGVGYYKSSMV